jgi:hypothetical protein
MAMLVYARVIRSGYMRWKLRQTGCIAVVALLLGLHFACRAGFAQDGPDWVTKFPREPVHISAWPGGKKVAVSFALFVEVFGFGQGPVLRPDLATRNPDLVNEAFRHYAITAGNLRVGRLFKELDVPLSIVLNAAFPGTYASVWKEFRAAQPKAPVIAHGMNNSNDILPLGRGLAEQKDYIRRTVDLIASSTGGAADRLVQSQRLFQRRYHAGHGCSWNYLQHRPDGF